MISTSTSSMKLPPSCLDQAHSAYALARAGARPPPLSEGSSVHRAWLSPEPCSAMDTKELRSKHELPAKVR